MPVMDISSIIPAQGAISNPIDNLVTSIKNWFVNANAQMNSAAVLIGVSDPTVTQYVPDAPQTQAQMTDGSWTPDMAISPASSATWKGAVATSMDNTVTLPDVSTIPWTLIVVGAGLIGLVMLTGGSRR